MIIDYLLQIHQIALNKIEQFTDRKNWQIELTFAIPIIVLFFSFPSYERLFNEDATNWNALFQQAAHPFENNNYDATSHQSKMTFRLFVPLLIRLFHLHIFGVITIEFLFGIATVYFFIRTVLSITHNKTVTVMLTLAFASTTACKSPFNDILGHLDGFALFFLIIPFATRNSILIFCAVFLSAWVDERGLIASSLIFNWIVFIKKEDNKNKKAVAIVIAWAAYLMLRWFLSYKYHLITYTEAVGIDILLNQLNNAPLGIWTGLEGFWLMVILSLIILMKQQQKVVAFLFLGNIGIIILVALSVIDITRSMIYLFPSIFIALNIIKDVEKEKNLIYIATFALLLCMLFPKLTVGGYNTVNWQYPLPLQILRYLAGHFSFN